MSIVYIVALESELPQQHDMDIRYCGVGKVNAAHATMKAIADGATKIVNFGTAGLVCKKDLKGLHKVTHIKERDMQAEPQAPRGVTPFEETPFAGEIELSPLREITLGTGDSFVQAPDQWFDEAQIDIVDMEAYGIAKICAKEQIDFECYKYITDFADEDAMKDWEQNQANGAEAFLNIVK